MKTISIDIETFSSVSLAKSGVYKYSEAEDFEVLLFGYAADGGPVQVVDLASGEEIPAAVLSALTDESVTKWAFNAQFERVCLSRLLGYPSGIYLPPSSWRCTMVWAATLGLPLSLEGVGAVLGLEKQKLTEGKELVKFFCAPARDKAGGLVRHTPSDAPEKWMRFKAYNKRDVETEMGIQGRLAKFPVSESEWRNYALDQEINDRGISLDMSLVNRAIDCDRQIRAAQLETARNLTGLENPNSTDQLKGWLAGKGIETESLTKRDVEEMLKDAPDDVAEMLNLRRQLAKSSVKKYTAMKNAVCKDSRARGLIQFYGANRTGRYAGRLIQVQNLPQNHLPDLEIARNLIKAGLYEDTEMLFGFVPFVLSELIRTAFVPKKGCKFFVADFSAIEARVIAWFAGETWRQRVFAEGGDIYCASASQMFRVPVEKHGVNGHLRQKGKQAELACIAEGQLVLTDKGLIPIEAVTKEHLLWDGENWVRHEGVVFKGEREVIEYEGLKATPDHLVWIEGESKPVQFGVAASSGAHLIQTGDGRRAIRLGENYQRGKTLEQTDEPLLCVDEVHGLRSNTMAKFFQPPLRQVKRMPRLFTGKENTVVASQTPNSGKTEMRKSLCSRIQQLWRSGYKVFFQECDRGRSLSHKCLWTTRKGTGDRPHRQQRKLCSGQSSVCYSCGKQQEQAMHRSEPVFTRILALYSKCSNSQAVSRTNQSGDYSGCGNSGVRKTEKLETHKRTARLYDIRNAGRYHRFTVSGKLVHNCGYGGSVGALKAMGALQMGLSEEELKPLVDAWRLSNAKIVQFWWAVDKAVKDCIKTKTPTQTHGVRFFCRSGLLFIELPSGRRLAYVKPRIGENRFGGESVTYEGVGSTKKWERCESYGPKFVENIVQATSRDILAEAMMRLNAAGYRIVMHVHDEVVIEAGPDASLSDICDIMGRSPAWAESLSLRADGYVCDFYRKD